MRYVALLRGVNVGGKTMIKMEALRNSFEAHGLGNVKSYINSGNLAFDHKPVDDKELAILVRDLILDEFGRDISVMVRSVPEIEQVIAGNPFVGQFDNDKDCHVLFLETELSDEKRELLLEKNSDVERIAVEGRTIYYLLRISIVDSVLGKGFVDKKLKVPSTARNWRTVNKLAEL